MLYIPIVIYVPALAFSQVSGFSLEALIPAVCIVCIFYTTLVSKKLLNNNSTFFQLGWNKSCRMDRHSTNNSHAFWSDHCSCDGNN